MVRNTVWRLYMNIFVDCDGHVVCARDCSAKLFVRPQNSLIDWRTQTNTQTRRQTDRHADAQTHRQTNKQTHRHRQTHRHTETAQ